MKVGGGKRQPDKQRELRVRFKMVSMRSEKPIMRSTRSLTFSQSCL